MSFDSSRFTFDPWNDFFGVVMQQGRVQLDSDWNEWLAEFARRIQAGTLDIVGTAGVPEITKDGFKITIGSDSTGVTIDIGPGRMYVDGLLAENHGLPAPNPEKWTPEPDANPLSSYPDWDRHLDDLVGHQLVDYNFQPYYPNPAAFPQSGGPYLIYLDVWVREVTFLEDPGLVEKAVGVDTTGRLQTVWQVKWMDVSSIPGVTCATKSKDIPAWASLHLPPPRLTTGVVQTGTPGPCCLTPNTGYTGQENQLYRVEIHKPGSLTGGSSPAATFKWSNNNASVETGVTAITQGGTVLTVESTGKDEVLSFAQNDWVEITDDFLELNGLPGELHQVQQVNDGAKTITLATAIVTPGNFPTDSQGNTSPSRHTRLIRWDQSGQILESDGKTVWVDLNAAGAGDIPVPPAGTSLILENGITVSFDQSATQSQFTSGQFWNFAARNADGTVEYLDKAPPRGPFHHYARLALVTLPSTVKDCRNVFPPLTKIQKEGCCCCTVTVGDGVTSHGDYSDIQSAVNALTGTGLAEICILPGAYSLPGPVSIARSNLTIEACPQANIQASATGPAFQVTSASQVAFDSLTVTMNIASPVIGVTLGSQVTIQNCNFTIESGEAPAMAVEVQSAGLDIHDSVFAGGGIWVADGSSQISIRNNTIANSSAAGIFLGTFPPGFSPAPTAAGVVVAEISNNQITGAAGSGIIAIGSSGNTLKTEPESGDIEDLLIEGNIVSGCCQNPASEEFGAVVLRNAQMARIHENNISGNGALGDASAGIKSAPTWGIFANEVLGLEIADNVIQDNGAAAQEQSSGPQGGIKAQIVMDGIRIHGNRVRTPSGPTLSVLARGPVSVVNNNLESQGVWPSTSTVGMSVLILNVGLPLELGAISVDPITLATSQLTLNAPSKAFDFSQEDGRTLFEGNQVTFLGELPAGAMPNVFFTLDDLAMEDNQFDTVSPQIMSADTFSLALFSNRSAGNRFSEIVGTAYLSHWGLSRYNIVAENQGTHCIVATGANPLAPNNQVMVSTICQVLNRYLNLIFGES